MYTQIRPYEDHFDPNQTHGDHFDPNQTDMVTILIKIRHNESILNQIRYMWRLVWSKSDICGDHFDPNQTHGDIFKPKSDMEKILTQIRLMGTTLIQIRHMWGLLWSAQIRYIWRLFWPKPDTWRPFLWSGTSVTQWKSCQTLLWISSVNFDRITCPSTMSILVCKSVNVKVLNASDSCVFLFHKSYWCLSSFCMKTHVKILIGISLNQKKRGNLQS